MVIHQYKKFPFFCEVPHAVLNDICRRVSALRTTKEELLKKIENLGLKDYAEFILKKLNLEIGKFNFNDNGTCKRIFISTLVEHPKYREHFAHILAPVYSVLIEEVALNSTI